MKKQFKGHDVFNIIMMVFVLMTTIGSIVMIIGMGLNFLPCGKYIGFTGIGMLVIGFLGSCGLIAIESGR